LTNALDDRYFNLENYFGTKKTQLIAQSHRAAIDFIVTLVKKHNIECDLETVKAYLFVPPGESVDILEKEFETLKRIGLNDVSFVDRAPLVSFDTGISLCFSDQAQFSPLPYLEKLSELIEMKNGDIFCHTHVENVIEKKEHFEIKTNSKFCIQARHVVLATNTYTTKRFFPHLKQAPYRTYVIAGEIPKGSITKAIYYDTCDPYHYIRIFSQKDSDLLIVGGEDHRTAEKSPIAPIYKALEEWTRSRFPQLKKIQYYWSGQVIEPIDSLAFIGRIKAQKEKYIITGDSGNGLTHGTLGAILIRDLILRRENPWEEIYDPHRLSFKNTKDFVKENANSFCQYRDWVTKGDVSSKKQLKKGCGAILRKGIKKYACFRTEKGEIKQFSAVCPHLGALVRWNESEECWECAAHGSRFNTEGEVLQGPANSNLKKVHE